MAVGTFAAEPLPPETETRIAQFSDLVATAIANTDARAEVERLAEEQAALRRVATLVAQRAQPAEIFAAVGEEVGRVFGLDVVMVSRFDPDGPAHVIVGVANRFEGLTVGSRFELDESMASAAVYRTGRSARVDGVDWSAVSAPSGEVARRLGSVSAVSSPIVVEGRLWGAITMADKEPLPLHAEARLEQFTRLVGTAVAGAESREALKELADEQAALRRVATLVAKGAPATAVFDAVAAEVERLLGADGVTLSRYEPDDQVRVVAHRGPDVQRVPPGTRVTHRGQDVATMVRRSERTARLEHHEKTRGAVAQLARDVGVRASVGAPIVVDGRLWGVVIATWRGEQSPPADTQARMAKFAQLLDTAVANADSRDQLTASRARLLTEADAARRHVVRDLHDGAQQRLVQTIVTLRLAEQALEEEDGNAHSLVAAALEQAEQGNAELRELAQGILPPVLTRGGLRAAVRSVVRRLDLPVEVDIPSDRFSPAIEASAYFIVAEALTNVVKHAQADRAVVKASVEGARLRLEVRDDGIGGADPDGHGLLGIADRVTALGGRLDVDSPAGVGTVLCATLPLAEG
jgi:signal transduction histidine kinase